MDYERQLNRLKKRVEFLEKELLTDELTRVFNRRGLMTMLKPLVGAVNFHFNNPDKRKNFFIQNLSVAFVDVDYFKKINDTFGHPAGDVALKKVAELLRQGVRGVDIVGRYGGEEMVVGLVGANAAEAERIANQLRAEIEQTPIVFEKATLKVTASFGVATLAKDMTLDELLAKADKALYEAKNTGRNKVVVAR